MINKCELYIMVGKKNDPRLVVFLQSVYGRERKKYKNKRYLLTLRVGNAISTAVQGSGKCHDCHCRKDPQGLCLDRARRKTFLAFLMLGPISRPWTRPCRLVSPIRWPRPWLVETHAFPSQPFRGRGNTGSSLLPKPEDTAIGGSAPSTSCDLFRQRELSGSGTF